MLYFDNNATTKIDPDVRKVMAPFLDADFANPSSPYTFARKAALAVEKAREQVAALVGAAPEEIYFTSGGTEGNNAALNHLLQAGGGALALSAVEHASVANFARRREKAGARLTWLPVLPSGALKAAGDREIPHALMWANNETGVVFPIAELAAGRRVHADAVQAAGKIPVDFHAAGIETASLSAHKIHGPKGVGALYVRKGVSFEPYLVGGDQERGFRAGTENVAGIVGFGRAAELARENLGKMETEIRTMRYEFEMRMLQKIPGLSIVGHESPRLPNTSMLIVPGVETETLIALLDMADICVSSGSACAAGAQEPSHVLAAMGATPARPAATIRVSLSRFTTQEELGALQGRFWQAMEKLRNG